MVSKPGLSLEKILLLAAAVCITILIAFVDFSRAKSAQQSAGVNQVKKNRAAVAQCRQDKRLCLGGYLKWKDGRVLRINNCEPHCGSRDEIEVIELIVLETGQVFNQVDAIALPDDSEWGVANWTYGRQFVVHSR